MILSERDEFADATALSTAATGRALIGDVIDLGVGRNLGAQAAADKPLFLVIQVTTAPTSGGSATLNFELTSDAQAAIAVDGSASVHGSLPGALTAIATFTAGKPFIMAISPEGGIPFERYLGIVQNVGVAALTAGAINAFLTTNPKTWKALKANVG